MAILNIQTANHSSARPSNSPDTPIIDWSRSNPAEVYPLITEANANGDLKKSIKIRFGDLSSEALSDTFETWESKLTVQFVEYETSKFHGVKTVSSGADYDQIYRLMQALFMIRVLNFVDVILAEDPLAHNGDIIFEGVEETLKQELLDLWDTLEYQQVDISSEPVQTSCDLDLQNDVDRFYKDVLEWTVAKLRSTEFLYTLT